MNPTFYSDSSLDEIKKLLLDESLDQDTRLLLKFLLLGKADRDYVERCTDEFLATLEAKGGVNE